jgi:hypothetical protein
MCEELARVLVWWGLILEISPSKGEIFPKLTLILEISASKL